MCRDCSGVCPNKKELSEKELKNIAGAGVPDCLTDHSLHCDLIGKEGLGYWCTKASHCQNPTKVI